MPSASTPSPAPTPTQSCPITDPGYLYGDELDKFRAQLELEMYVLFREYADTHDIPEEETAPDTDIVERNLRTALMDAGCIQVSEKSASWPREWFNAGMPAAREVYRYRPATPDAEATCPLPEWHGGKPWDDNEAFDAFVRQIADDLADNALEWISDPAPADLDNLLDRMDAEHDDLLASLGCATDYRLSKSAEGYVQGAQTAMFEQGSTLLPQTPDTDRESGDSGGDDVPVPDVNAPDVNPFYCSWTLRGGLNCGLHT